MALITFADFFLYGFECIFSVNLDAKNVQFSVFKTGQREKTRKRTYNWKRQFPQVITGLLLTMMIIIIIVLAKSQSGFRPKSNTNIFTSQVEITDVFNLSSNDRSDNPS